MQSQKPSWGSHEQQHTAQENGAWTGHGDQSQVSTNTWEADQMQAAASMDNGNHAQMEWQQNEQWEAQPDQVSYSPTYPLYLAVCAPAFQGGWV